MILPILQYPNPKLLEKSNDVTKFDDKLSELIESMIETCQATDNCVGLAAIQVGIPMCLSVIKTGKKYIHIINPEIVFESKELSSEWEGCMSIGVGDDQLFSSVARDKKITVKYYDKYQKQITKQCEGFLAHAFQHEIDHMNGILFLKYATDPTKIWKDKDLNAYIAKNNHLP
jgi:peptide deformylase